VRVSAKTGEGVPDLLEALVKRIPPPKGDPDAPLQALIIDSWFDNYVGVVSLVRVMNGSIKTGDKLRIISTGRSHTVDKLGRFTPKSVGAARAGHRPTLASSLPASRKSTARGRRHHHPGESPQPPTACRGSNRSSRGYSPVCFPINSEDYEAFRDALSKLRLNDSALHYEPEVSGALGFGFRIGFLGLLHMDIVQETAGAGVQPRAGDQRADGGL